MKNEYKVTRQVYRSWAKENMFKDPYLAILIMWCVLAFVTVIVAVITKFPLYLLLTAFCLYRAFVRNIVIASGQYNKMAKTYGMENWTRTIEFEEDNILLSEENFSVRYQYDDIKTIRENGNKVWLDFKNRTVIRLYKDAFTEGDWQECKDMIEGKRG